MGLEKLPVLNSIVNKILTSKNPAPLANATVVYIHHALESSLTLLKSTIKLGLLPKNIFVLNKYYSQCESIAKEIKNLGINYQSCSEPVGLGRFSQSFIYDISILWHNVLTAKQGTDKLIIMDHGGYALNYIPAEILHRYNVIGVEKTRAGFINFNLDDLPFPIIDIASCAAKKILESPLIAEAVVAKLMPLVPIKESYLTCCVIGYGAIGKALSKKLSSLKHRVIAYDKQIERLKEAAEDIVIADDLASAIRFSDYIFGCTGQDISKSIDLFRHCYKDKVLISCSSEDKEFLSLLRHIQQQHPSDIHINPLHDITWKNDVGANIRIVRGGFPVNFDGSKESVPSNDIQLTRSLVLAGALQAVDLFKETQIIKRNGKFMLDPDMQKFIINEWINVQPLNRFDQQVIKNFQDKQWIIENSSGMYHH